MTWHGSTWQTPHRIPRLLAATGALAVVVAVSGCDNDEPPVLPTAPPSLPSVTASPAEPGLDLPEVPGVADQPEPVAARFGETVTVAGSDLFGTTSATIEVTLAEPVVVRDVDLDNGVVYTPEEGVFVGVEATIAGVDGVYDFNPVDFHLVPAEEATTSSGDAFVYDDPTAAHGWANTGRFEPGLTPTPVSAGAQISGYFVFDVPAAAVDDAAIVLEPLLLVDGQPAAYWLLG